MAEFDRVEVPGDGNCFFHALAWSLNIGDLHSRCLTPGSVHELVHAGNKLRSHLIRRDSWGEFLRGIEDEAVRACAPSFEEAVHPRTYVNDFILSYLVQTYPIGIAVFVRPTPTKGPLHTCWYCATQPAQDTPVFLFALWKQHEHFNPLRHRDSPRVSPGGLVGQRVLSALHLKQVRPDIWVHPHVDVHHLCPQLR